MDEHIKPIYPTTTVKIKRLDPGLPLPSYAKSGDAGVDLHATKDVIVHPMDRTLIPTGIAIQLPRGVEAQVRSRSGLALKKGIFVLNSPGTIDSGYTGEIGVILFNTTNEPFCVKRGDRIAQLVFSPVYQAEFKEVDELEETERGGGGFGSTGV